eukprot:2934030-Prymnesium_polylepis.1
MATTHTCLIWQPHTHLPPMAVATNEIKTGTEFDDLAESELMAWLQQGTVFKKFNHGWATAQPHHPCRVWIRGSS